MVMIYDHRGNPVKTQQLTRELAAPSLAGIRTVWDQTVAGGLTPLRLASLLIGAAQGDANDYLTLAEEMEERDLHYRCEIGKRKLAVASLPVVVESASDDEKDVKLADEIRALVKKGGFRAMLKDQLDALAKGYSVCEIIWQRGATWTPMSYEWRDPRFFIFDRASRQQLRLLDEENLAEGIELAPYKFIVHLPHLKTGIPIRGGLARVAAWAWMFKNYTVKDWMAFAEIFGMPLRVGKYGPGASDTDIQVLKMAVANLGSDAAAVVPDSMLIEFVEGSKSTGTSDLYQRLADYLDAQISRGILGQTATTQGTPGKLGNEDAQAEVREDIRDDDASQLAETLNRDLVKPFIDLNFGPQENYPELILRQVEKDDLTVLTSALEKLVPLGLRVEQSVVRDKFGLPDPADDAECLGVKAPAEPPPLTAGKSGPEGVAPLPKAKNREEADVFDGPHPAETIADKMMSDPVIDPMLDRARDLLDDVESLEEYRDRLLDIYNEMDPSALGNLLSRAMVMAELAGRFDAAVGAEE